MSTAQVLTAAQMRSAEQALFDAGTSVSQLMDVAAGGTAEWIRRVAAGRSVTVLCGPGNNGGDGYVIARLLREAGNAVTVIAPLEPATAAAKEARRRWGASTKQTGTDGVVLVDCLFGSGLSRPLAIEHALLLADLAARHRYRIAVDVPSGIASDSGAVLNERLPQYDLTLALGAWKFAHWSLPGRALMGQLRLVPIGIAPTEGAAQVINRPRIAAPATDSHKYIRGLLGIVSGTMPGASLLAAVAAQRAGAGYVKLLGRAADPRTPPDLVVDTKPLSEALADPRMAAVLVGPGLGRDGAAKAALGEGLRRAQALVLDADALVLLAPNMLAREVPMLATPHDGELETLCRTFGIIAEGRQPRVLALAKMTGMVVLAKGPDTVIAAPDGRLAIGTPAPTWLSVAGTGDVLAGIAASRMANGADPFTAACEAVWLHGEAARRSGPAFTASQLAERVSEALAACL
ncbi:MAG: bifunctional ADP-dependent NAD(P)H-hydrate dehydratase/NAD(P)H-hydrate epimerase [Alphaproteobacteria bacterium HGW-Alphaproteobacteria-14]|nr:MAG: bifunctional ADP-dependent NAD(P)H-hydrate dehydratase/NAD(P)H-hydrate epimerase [Alphaproteobacteria bacterium HGW-Alphaproteobacteria-14]